MDLDFSPWKLNLDDVELESPESDFNKAGKRRFFRGERAVVHSGYHKTLSPTIAWHRIVCDGET